MNQEIKIVGRITKTRDSGFVPSVKCVYYQKTLKGVKHSTLESARRERDELLDEMKKFVSTKQI